MSAVAESARPELQALFATAGVARHLEAWPEANQGARERARARLEPDVYAVWMREVQGAFAAGRLLADVEAALAASLGPEAARALRRGYTDHAANALLGNPAGISSVALRDFPAFASRVSRREIPPARFTLVSRLDEATGFGRNAWRVTGAVGGAITRGARALDCEPGAWRAPLPPEHVAERTRLARPFQERVHLELLFLNRSRESPALRRAVRVLESDAPRAFHASLRQALDAALESALRRLREGLAQRIAERCGGRGQGGPS
jgi:hypothetical protein